MIVVDPPMIFNDFIDFPIIVINCYWCSDQPNEMQIYADDEPELKPEQGKPNRTQKSTWQPQFGPSGKVV